MSNKLDKRAAAVGEFANTYAPRKALDHLALMLIALRLGLVVEAGEVTDPEDFLCLLEQLCAQAVYY